MPRYRVPNVMFVETDDADDAFDAALTALEDANGCCIDGYSIRRSDIVELPEEAEPCGNGQSP
jgi:hypothetical protein